MLGILVNYEESLRQEDVFTIPFRIHEFNHVLRIIIQTLTIKVVLYKTSVTTPKETLNTEFVGWDNKKVKVRYGSSWTVILFVFHVLLLTRRTVFTSPNDLNKTVFTRLQFYDRVVSVCKLRSTVESHKKTPPSPHLQIDSPFPLLYLFLVTFFYWSPFIVKSTSSAQKIFTFWTLRE